MNNEDVNDEIDRVAKDNLPARKQTSLKKDRSKVSKLVHSERTKPTFSRTGTSVKDAETNSNDPDYKPPALSKIPTNEFIENFYLNDRHSGKISTSNNNRQKIKKVSTGSRNTLVDPNEMKSRSSSCTEKTVPEEYEAAKEEDLETILDLTEEPSEYDETGLKIYGSACRKFKALPSNSLQKKLANATEIDFQNYGLGPKEAMALAIPLVFNTKIVKLNLRGNDLREEGLKYVCQMMSENTSVADLDISENKIHAFNGSRLVSRMLVDNSNLVSLNLEDNGLTDADAEMLCESITEHAVLRHLNLSRNEFGSPSGYVFKKVLAENEVLQELHLRWNKIRMPGAFKLAQGMQDNVTLKILDLSWNGFEDKGALGLADALKNCVLQELDLSANRISAEGALKIIASLKNNNDLKILKLGRNNLNEETAILMLNMVYKLDDLTLELLDLSELVFRTKEFVASLTNLQEKYPDLTIKHGYSDSYGQRKLKEYDVVEEAMNAMKEYMAENNLNLAELFSKFDEDGSMSVTYDEFKQGLKEAKIPLSSEQIEQLIKALDQDGDGEIDFSELATKMWAK
ncbi:DgyrCDS1082 [Dimorphilus gyrociliatus]|uniref:DgyrCDS1082 n=1 Tax=Dimorphilus gyrociliatus TaxID=2664684 RepID=A0A7I8V7N6_9ANNE|nr:DgyrCDS1082 [Dimorphilus gyrociliatus]